MSEITMGEATKAAQGYPTQIWLPVRPPLAARDTAALIHDRGDSRDQPGTFFIPGNRIRALFTPGTEEHAVAGDDGRMQKLRIPDAVLWENHGGPCEYRGAEYRKIGERVMNSVYQAILLDKRPVIIPGGAIGTNGDYMGPFDYALPSAPLQDGQRPQFSRMSPDLLVRR